MPAPAPIEAATAELPLPQVVESLQKLDALSLTEPMFWAELFYGVLDYSPWTPDLNAFSGQVIEQAASMMGLFSTSQRYRISSRFGPRYHPILKKRRQHNGLDLAAPTGTPVRAVQDGTITYAARRGAYGKFVAIEHDVPWATEYAHLSKIMVLPGVEVEQGDVIGKVGTTGRSTGPHLHFIVREDGTPVDPLSAEGFYYISPIIPLSYNLAVLKQTDKRHGQ